MTKALTTREIRNRIQIVRQRLNDVKADPSNVDRALWASLAVTDFAGVTGQEKDVHIDPETVLGDLLADLMHWCDTQQFSDLRLEPISFESALERARNHYDEEAERGPQGTHES